MSQICLLRRDHYTCVYCHRNQEIVCDLPQGNSRFFALYFCCLKKKPEEIELGQWVWFNYSLCMWSSGVLRSIKVGWPALKQLRQCGQQTAIHCQWFSTGWGLEVSGADRISCSGQCHRSLKFRVWTIPRWRPRRNRISGWRPANILWQYCVFWEWACLLTEVCSSLL